MKRDCEELGRWFFRRARFLFEGLLLRLLSAAVDYDGTKELLLLFLESFTDQTE